MKKYFKRALRYFLYLSIIWLILVSIMIATGHSTFSSASITDILMTRNFLVLIVVVVLFSALYPKMGYINKLTPKIVNRALLEEEFARIGIILCKEEGNIVYYQYESKAKRFMVKFDDTFTIQYNENSAIIDGNRVMIARIWSKIEYVIEK